jgi:hypothetical protein
MSLGIATALARHAITLTCSTPVYSEYNTCLHLSIHRNLPPTYGFCWISLVQISYFLHLHRLYPLAFFAVPDMIENRFLFLSDLSL